MKVVRTSVPDKTWHKQMLSYCATPKIEALDFKTNLNKGNYCQMQ